MGFLNLTYPTLSLLPPFDLIRHLVSLPGRAFRRHRGPTFFPKDRFPFRVVGGGVGVSMNFSSDAFTSLLLLPNQAADIDSIIRRTDSVTVNQSAPVPT